MPDEVFIPQRQSQDGLLEFELKCIKKRREGSGSTPGRPRLGVALSGGGIRSATFNLGILQELTKLGWLHEIDYLSTVSGGGYIGTWLHGVIKKADGKPQDAEKYLRPPDDRPHEKIHPKDEPISFLRKYASYLAPDIGLLSADFWLIAVIWLRNTFLNQAILIPGIVAVSLFLFLIGAAWNGGDFGNTTQALQRRELYAPAIGSQSPVALGIHWPSAECVSTIAAMGIILLMISATSVSLWFLRREVDHGAGRDCDSRLAGSAEGGFATAVSGAFFVAAALLALCYRWVAYGKDAWLVGLGFFFLYLFFQLRAGFLQTCETHIVLKSILFPIGGAAATSQTTLANGWPVLDPSS